MLTNGDKNYQMFTYCPNLSQASCGISSDRKNRDTKLTTKLSKQKLAPNLRHVAGSQNTREHDGCYYVLDHDYNINKDKGTVIFKLTKLKEVNVYIYKGNNRNDATTGLVPGNQMPSIGQEYQVDFHDSILVVAFPNENVQTEFEFEYWIGEETQ